MTGATQDIFGYVPHHRQTRSKRKFRIKKNGFGPNAFLVINEARIAKLSCCNKRVCYQDKPIQKWEEYDGFGRYQYRHHKFPNNKTLNDLQKRRVFAAHAEQRLRINAVRKADVLPREIRRLADQEVLQVPRDSAITRLNRRCTLSGRARGIFHQFRVSRIVWRQHADYNKLSGVQRAQWLYGIHIKP